MTSPVERIMNSANAHHGLTLQPSEIRQVAGAMMRADQSLQFMQAVLTAYMNQHGPDILNTVAEGYTVVEGEIAIDAEGSDETPQGERDDSDATESVAQGQIYAEDWVDPQVAEIE